MSEESDQVSVIIPTFNRRKFLKGAIDSALSQTLKPKEVVVVDDCSTDGTIDWLSKAYTDLTLISLPSNQGAAQARNIGIEKVRGNLVAFLDSDDQWDVEYLEKSVSALAHNPGAVMSVSDVRIRLVDTGELYVHRSRRNPGYHDLVHHLLLENFVTTMSSVIVRSSSIVRAGNLDPRFSVVHDRDWYIRLARLGEIVSVEEPLVTRVIHTGSLVSDLEAYRCDVLFFLRDFFGKKENQTYLNTRVEVLSKTLFWFAAQHKQHCQYLKALTLHLKASGYAISGNTFTRQTAAEIVVLLKLLVRRVLAKLFGFVRSA